MKYLLFSFIMSLIVLSCEKKKSTQNIENIPISNLLSSDSISNLIEKALTLGDRSSYNRASSYYFLHDKSEEFLYTAIIMANKYDDSEAYYHVYKILNSSRNQDKLDMLDERTKNIALFYILRSYELGYSQSKFEIAQIFRKDERIPKSTQYLK